MAIERNKVIVNSDWIDKDTFIVNFAPIPTKEDFEIDGVTEEVIVEFHKDENKWVVDKQYYDCYGEFIDHDTNSFNSIDRTDFLSFAYDEYIKVNCDDDWEKVIAVNGYDVYDTLVERLVEHYGGLGIRRDHIESVVTSHLVDILKTLKKNIKLINIVLFFLVLKIMF